MSGKEIEANGAGGNAVVTVSAGRFPYVQAIEERYGVTKAQWRALTDAIFPRAKTLDSILLALSYCQARNLDIFKRPVHIVPMWSTEANGYVDTIWPGIGELRTTASRTKGYAGRDATIWGPDITAKYGEYEVKHPEWAEVVVRRVIGPHIAIFHGPRVYWAENYSPEKFRKPEPNEMWRKRPRGQLEKCAEAAALRQAFPEEIGNEYTADEMEGKVIEGRFESVPGSLPPPAATQQPVKNRLNAFAGKAEEPEEAMHAEAEPDEAVNRAALKAITERLDLCRNTKSLKEARKEAIPLMGRFDEVWPEGKEQIVLKLAEVEARITEGADA